MPVRRHPVAVPARFDPLGVVPIDTGLVDRLRETYARLAHGPGGFVDIFYRKLFESAPEVRPMFRDDPNSRAGKLRAALDLVVQNLDRPSETAAVLAAMGQRHAGYGVRAEHYELVVTLLVDAMRESLGEEASEDRLEEWREALRLVGAQMLAAGTAAGRRGE